MIVIMCDCATFTARGCWEHAGYSKSPERIMSFRCGFADGSDPDRKGKGGAQAVQHAETYYRRPLTTWDASEQDEYKAGWALATGGAWPEKGRTVWQAKR